MFLLVILFWLSLWFIAVAAVALPLIASKRSIWHKIVGVTCESKQFSILCTAYVNPTICSILEWVRDDDDDDDEFILFHFVLFSFHSTAFRVDGIEEFEYVPPNKH